jgi:hypothetical protein
MRAGRAVLVVGLLTGAGGCYHATVETGAPPAPETITKGWASGWIYGLVPPSVVETAQRCPNGVARIETQLSFANQLVSFLTLGIYTPMDIRVTCAANRSADGGDEPVVRVGPDEPAVVALARAAELSRQLGVAVSIAF